jgi:hypothetical protein
MMEEFSRFLAIGLMILFEASGVIGVDTNILFSINCKVCIKNTSRDSSAR